MASSGTPIRARKARRQTVRLVAHIVWIFFLLPIGVLAQDGGFEDVLEGSCREGDPCWEEPIEPDWQEDTEHGDPGDEGVPDDDCDEGEPCWDDEAAYSEDGEDGVPYEDDIGEILCVEGEPCWEEEDAYGDPRDESEPEDLAYDRDAEEDCYEGERCWEEGGTAETYDESDPADVGYADDDEDLCYKGEPCWEDDGYVDSSEDAEPDDLSYDDDGGEILCVEGEACWEEELAQEERRYCAKRLPDQMPRTCRVRDVPVGDSLDDFRAYFRSWVARCVHRSRIDKHMRDNAGAIEEIWGDVQGQEVVTVHVHVTPLEFIQDGEVCLGVESMRYELARQPTQAPKRPDPVPEPHPDRDRDRDDISEGFDDVVAKADPDALDKAARDAADCFEVETSLLSAWKDLVVKVFAAVPLSKLEGRYECLYDAFAMGYPVGVAAGLLELPPSYVRNRLMARRQGPPAGYFECRALKLDATDVAIGAGYQRIRRLSQPRRKAQYDLVRDYIKEHDDEASQQAGPRVRQSVPGVDGQPHAHPQLVYLTAWAVKNVYGIRKPRNPMSPMDFRECVQKAIKKAAKDYAKDQAKR